MLVDEGLLARDLLCLAVRDLALDLLVLRALARVSRIAAAVLDDGPVLERERARGDAVEEPAIVTGYQDRQLLFYKELLEPLERGEIEVVRRLVEQEDVGVVEEEAREAEPRALAA
jgi:hypothetical protein